MPDIIDIANEREALFRERAIAEARRCYRPMPITGRCYNCEEKKRPLAIFAARNAGKIGEGASMPSGSAFVAHKKADRIVSIMGKCLI